MDVLLWLKILELLIWFLVKTQVLDLRPFIYLFIIFHHWKWFMCCQVYSTSTSVVSDCTILNPFQSWTKHIEVGIQFPINSTQLWVPNSCQSLLKKLAMKTLTWQCCYKLETFLKENVLYEVYRKTNVAFTLKNLLVEV